MEALKTAGLVDNVGVSNFDVTQLQALLELTDTRVGAVQNWCDPFHQDRWVRSLAERNGVVYMAYSSLGTQWLGKTGGVNPVLQSPELQRIAAAHSASVSEVVLCWLLQEGAVAIPRSSSPQHISDNSLGRLRDEPSGGFRCFLSLQDLSDILALDGTLGLPWE